MASLNRKVVYMETKRRTEENECLSLFRYGK